MLSLHYLDGRGRQQTSRRPALLFSVFAVALCLGCAPIARAEVSENALTDNALTDNALTDNALTENALTDNALTENALTDNALTAAALKDPKARLFLKYLIRVAFKPSQCETFQWPDPQTGSFPATYCGRLALCPQWQSRGVKDDIDCQEWVTAGLLAHLNAFGIKVPFSARAVNPPLLVVSEFEATAFRYREAAFWGNLFKRPRALYAASDVRNVEIAKLNRRLCAQKTGTCSIQVIGPLDSASLGADVSRGWACEITASTLTWTVSLNDPSNFFKAEPGDLANLRPTFDQAVSACHPYLTATLPPPTVEQAAGQTLRVVNSYLTEAGLKRMYGCSPTLFPAPTGPCTESRAGGCEHPGDSCCQAGDGSHYCEAWTRANGHSVQQACVNDEVAEGDQAQFTCAPRP